MSKGDIQRLFFWHLFSRTRLLQAVDKVGHHLVVAAHVTVEGQLVAGAVQVVGGMLDLVVGVAIQVVGEEPHALHEGEQRHGIG